MKRKRGKTLSRKEFFSKVLNVAMFTFCSSILAYHVYVCLIRLLIGRTRITSDMQPTNKSVIPGFTVCPGYNNYSYKEDVLKAYGTSKDEFVHKGNFFNNGTDPIKVYNCSTHTLPEILCRIEIQLLTSNASATPVNIKPGSPFPFGDWTEMRTSHFGRCYELILNYTALKWSIMNIVFAGNIDFYIFIHHPGQLRHIDSASKVFAQMGERLYVDMSYEISHNHETKANCKKELDFGFDRCIHEQLNRVLVEKYGCSVPFIDHASDPCMSKNSTLTLEILKTAELYEKNAQFNLCGFPCTSIEVYMGLPTYDVYTDRGSYAKIYLRTRTRVKTSVYDYTILTMIAEVGGTTGLLLGISLIQLCYKIKEVMM